MQCKIPLPTNNSMCNIPCEVSGCDVTVHHYMNCPIWTCSPIQSTTASASTTTVASTTTESFTTSDPTRSTTTPYPEPQSHFNFSIFLNVIFALILFAFLAFYTLGRYQKYRRSQNYDIPMQNLEAQGSSLMIPTETEPLINQESTFVSQENTIDDPLVDIPLNERNESVFASSSRLSSLFKFCKRN